MVSQDIIASLISSAFALLGALAGSYMVHSKTIYRIEQLEKKVDKHNNLVDRTYKLEATTALLDQRVDLLERSDTK